eukprot:1256876-Pleurochrysis_carterae.AAC.1
MHTDYKAEKLKPENILKDVNWEHSCPYSFEVCAAPATQCVKYTFSCPRFGRQESPITAGA